MQVWRSHVYNLAIISLLNIHEKETVIRLIKDLPNEFELEVLIEKLIFVEKVDVGLKQLEKGKVVNHKDLKRFLKIAK